MYACGVLSKKGAVKKVLNTTKSAYLTHVNTWVQIC